MIVLDVREYETYVYDLPCENRTHIASGYDCPCENRTHMIVHVRIGHI